MRKLNRKKDKGRSNENVTIKRSAFLDMLRKIHLGGAVNECVIEFDKGRAISEVVDITNSIVTLANAEVNHKDRKFRIASEGFSAQIGIGSIEILMKFLSSVNDELLTAKLSTEGDSLHLSSKSGSRRLNYLTSVIDLISTRLRMEDDDEDYREHFLNMPDAAMVIDSHDAKDLCSYIGLTRSKVVTIAVDDDTATFTVGSNTEHKFTVEVDLEEETDDPYEVKTNGDNLSKVLNTCVFSEDVPTMISIGEEAPIIITDATTLWCLTPIEDTDGD